MTQASDDPFATGPAGDEEFELEWSNDIEPEGIAEMQLLDVQKQTSKSGNPMLVWTFQLLGYIEPAGAGAEFVGSRFDVYTVQTSNAMWKMEEVLAALGMQVQAGANRVRFQRQQVIGIVVEASIKHGSFNGRPQAEIDSMRTSQKGKQPIADTFAPPPAPGGTGAPPQAVGNQGQVAPGAGAPAGGQQALSQDPGPFGPR